MCLCGCACFRLVGATGGRNISVEMLVRSFDIVLRGQTKDARAYLCRRHRVTIAATINTTTTITTTIAPNPPALCVPVSECCHCNLVVGWLWLSGQLNGALADDVTSWLVACKSDHGYVSERCVFVCCVCVVFVNACVLLALRVMDARHTMPSLLSLPSHPLPLQNRYARAPTPRLVSHLFYRLSYIICYWRNDDHRDRERDQRVNALKCEKIGMGAGRYTRRQHNIGGSVGIAGIVCGRTTQQTCNRANDK